PTLQGILRVRADGSETQEVYLSPDPLATQSYLAGWSPDGQSLLFWQGIQMSASLLADGAPLMRVPITGGAPIRISSGMLARQDFLVWSPDGQRLALVDGTGRSSWENKQITSITASGSFQLLSKAGHADLFPAWSPDGRWLAFSGVPAAPGIGGGDPAKAAMAQRRIWIIGRDGTERRQLTSDPSFRDERPRWSRDSDFILFPRLQGDQAQLWLIRADGTDLKKVVDELTPSPGWFGNYGYLDWGRLYDWWLGGPSLAGESHTGGRPKAKPSPTPMVAMSPIPNLTRV
ncbi:MAG: hypothetical protein Q8P00_03570, partial [Dehalococcoidia bacterium]|nr:hypothetical protein [Dehalococcoidia bacterium]